MNEIWIETNNKNTNKNTIIAFSNTGKMKLSNGSILPIPYRQTVTFKGKRLRLYRVIAELFIPKTQEDIDEGRDIIDHITHHPIGININDIRNLRWCTRAENNKFPEFRKHDSEGCKGRIPWNKGKHFSDDSKEKMRKAKIGKKLDDEHKLKISESLIRFYQKKKARENP